MDCTTESVLELPTPSPEIERTRPPNVPCATDVLELPLQAPQSERLVFVREKGHYHLAKQSKLKNSLLAAVGFLELANAGDFAANVWNTIPVPRFAIGLMAVGGTVALGISYYAFRDARLSRQNIIRLRDERRYLQLQKTHSSQDRYIVHCLDSLLDVNFRETGTEIVDRFGMDLLMGFAAVLVGVGTFMAIDGANPSVFRASNILSGYIGNAPCAVYGIINVAWSVYVWRRAHQHSAGAEKLEADTVQRMLKGRTDTIKLHAVMNGVTGAVSGGASLVTATMWWGYVVLAPCIASMIFCNYLWRRRIGYDRPLTQQVPSMSEASLSTELEFIASAQRELEEAPSDAFSKIVSEPESITSVVEFITKNDLFEDFCVRLLKDTELATELFGPSEETLIIDSQDFLAPDDRFVPRLLEIAQTCVSEMGLTVFRYRRRYLLEILGCYLCVSEFMTEIERASEKASEKASESASEIV